MSENPLGLNGEPFAPPLTLSAKETKNLIRRRVSAAGGDGALLFPAETCDEIHQLAGGIPEAIFHLAGESMRVAAAQGAPAVSPAHVQDAAGATERRAAVQADVGTGATERRSAGAPNEETGPVVATEQRAAVQADDVAATTSAGAGRTGTAPERRLIAAAGIALPSEPSASLPKEARAWVSRFLPSRRSGSSRGTAGRAVRAPTIHVATERDRTEASSVATEREPATVSTVAPSRPGSRPRGPRRRRRGPGGGAVSAAAIVCILALVVLQYRRGALTSAPGPGAMVPTSGPAIAPPLPATESAVTTDPVPAAAPAPRPALQKPARESRPSEPRTSAAVRPPARGSALPVARPSESRTGAPHATAAAAASTDAKREGAAAGAASPRRETPALRYGLEVATSIFEDRARSERQRLEAAGHRVRLVTAREYGSTVYCVVLGGYDRREAAERAADSLLTGGMVLQARIVTLPSGK